MVIPLALGPSFPTDGRTTTCDVNGSENRASSTRETMVEAGLMAGRCQARPRAARPEYREDMLCASGASEEVVFFGLPVGVCRIHESMYARWGGAAEHQAMTIWGWPPATTEIVPA